MWLRRMNAVSSTHLPPALAIDGFGTGTRESLPSPAKARSAIPASASSARARAGRRHASTLRVPERGMSLFAEPHLDVPGRAHVLADVAADALVVVGIDVASRRRFLLRHARHGGLRAIDDTVVALEALAAAHAALGFGDSFRFGQRRQAFLEVAERALAGQRGHGAPMPRRVSEMAEEELLVRNHVAVRAIVVVVNGGIAPVRSENRLVRLGKRKSLLDHLAVEIERVDVDLRPLFLVLAAQMTVDAFGRDRAVADRCREQMRADNVAAGERARLAGDLIVLVGGHRALTDVELLQSREVDCLTDGRDDEIGRDVFLGAFDHL